ncbi:hypothetical protein Bca52824_060387 [Brassica carinata]|uniref:Uncharacterized protein n=1 Tax=Brassica carinata TaxID=52824 RepID=A0A8X7UGG7_BRACI|nr:hypothetical protein Bca52824_060387 [Brassica carinata]
MPFSENPQPPPPLAYAAALRSPRIPTSSNISSPSSNLHLQNSAAHANPLRSEPSDGVAVWNRAPRTVNGEKREFVRGERERDDGGSPRVVGSESETSEEDLLRLDLGRRLERRIDEFGNELVKWVSEKEEGGEKSPWCSTVSVTLVGLCSYGTLLESFVGRQELVEKIKGCIIDSGGADPLDTKIWAAGFTAAILKKRSSTINTEPNSPGKKMSKERTSRNRKHDTIISRETIPHCLKHPRVIGRECCRRLTRITQRLYENHPPCPQLYLYSSEIRIKEQQKIGRKVESFNFKSSPHVDHYRNFPDLYSSQLHNFLQECFKPTKQQQQQAL